MAMRAATIKAFEFTYVVSLKMLRRHMTLAADNPADIHQMSFSSFIREAYGKNLVRSDIVGLAEVSRAPGHDGSRLR